MTIAILEICTHTHYSAINGLIKTYSTDPRNSIILFTNDTIAKAVRENGVPDKTDIIVFDPSKQDAGSFLKEIEKIPFDRLHICTIEDYFKSFAAFTPSVREVFFHVHDIDIWFDNHFDNGFKNWIFNVKNKPNRLRETAKFVRDLLVRNRQRQQIVQFVQSRKHRYVVHSAGQKQYLSTFVDADRIIVFPFAINEGVFTKPNHRAEDAPLRICIPGIVTDSRRDYTGLLAILDTILPDIKGKLMFDFLGFVEKSELHLLHSLQDLERRGLGVLYYTDFVYGKKFDAALDQADILLNNQKVTASHTTKYGVTKESGMLFNMVRAAKPGILPKAYVVDKAFENAVIYYETDEALKNLFLRLADKSIDIQALKAYAVDLAQVYTPHALYSLLVEEVLVK